MTFAGICWGTNHVSYGLQRGVSGIQDPSPAKLAPFLILILILRLGVDARMLLLAVVERRVSCCFSILSSSHVPNPFTLFACAVAANADVALVGRSKQHVQPLRIPKCNCSLRRSGWVMGVPRLRRAFSLWRSLWRKHASGRTSPRRLHFDPLLLLGTCSAKVQVTVVDINQSRIDAWNSDDLPIYEVRSHTLHMISALGAHCCPQYPHYGRSEAATLVLAKLHDVHCTAQVSVSD
jgi:hypothetical protein